MRRLFGLAWRYRLHSLQVLGIQLVLLALGIGGLSFTGVGIDYIRHKLDHSPPVPNQPAAPPLPPLNPLPPLSIAPPLPPVQAPVGQVSAVHE